MRCMLALALASSALLLLGSPAALAQPSWLSELRGGILSHDFPLGGHHKEGGIDGNFEVLFTSPAILEPILRPRPILGLSVNSAGKTSYGYGGLTWGVRFAPRLFGDADPIFATGSLGGAAHNGSIDIRGNLPKAATNKSLGSTVLFREALELGYEFVPHNSISVVLDHISNARLAKRNEGITNLGMRYGIRF